MVLECECLSSSELSERKKIKFPPGTDSTPDERIASFHMVSLKQTVMKLIFNGALCTLILIIQSGQNVVLRMLERLFYLF